MEILWWLAPPAAVAVIAMVAITWLGRPQREPVRIDRDEAAYERFAAALTREHPGTKRQRPVTVRERSTGIAVRPSRLPEQRRPESQQSV